MGRGVDGLWSWEHIASHPETSRTVMAAASTPAVVNAPITQQSGATPFDFSKPPVIEGFTPVSRRKDETFKEKLLRKTKDNPFVPIGELHKLNQWAVDYTNDLPKQTL